MPKIGTITTTVSTAIAAWAVFWPHPPEAVAAVLLATPWAALALIAAFGGRLNLYRNRQAAPPAVPETASELLRDTMTASMTGRALVIPLPDPPPAIGGLMVIPSFVLVWKAIFSGHIMGLTPILPYMAGLAVVVAGVAWLVDKTIADAKLGRTWLFAVAFVYGVCGALLINQAFDRGGAQEFPTSILHDDDRNTSGMHFLTLGVWEPAAAGYTQGVMVSSFAFAKLRKDSICVVEHPGALGLRWFEVTSCAPHPIVTTDALP